MIVGIRKSEETKYNRLMKLTIYESLEDVTKDLEENEIIVMNWPDRWVYMVEKYETVLGYGYESYRIVRSFGTDFAVSATRGSTLAKVLRGFLKNNKEVYQDLKKSMIYKIEETAEYLEGYKLISNVYHTKKDHFYYVIPEARELYKRFSLETFEVDPRNFFEKQILYQTHHFEKYA
mgnify:CR=1 FL=1